CLAACGKQEPAQPGPVSPANADPEPDKPEEPPKTDPEPVPETDDRYEVYLTELDSLENVEGRLMDLTARVASEEDGRFIEYDISYEFFLTEDNDEEGYRFLSGDMTRADGKLVRHYYDLSPEEDEAFRAFVKECGILGYNGYDVELKDAGEEDGLYEITAHFSTGEVYSLTAKGGELPEGFLEAWLKLRDRSFKTLGIALEGFTDFLPDADYYETQSMSNLNANAFYCQDDDYNLFGFAFNNGEQAVVKNPEWRDSTVIATGAVPYKTLFYGGYYYYIEMNSWELYRSDGKTAEMILDELEDYFVGSEGLFYTGADDHFLYKLDPDSGESSLVFRTPMDFAYAINGWVVYQDEDRGRNIFAKELSSGKTAKLTNGESYDPVVMGNTLYYLDAANTVCSVDLITGEEKRYEDMVTLGSMFVTPSYFYFQDANADGRWCYVDTNWMSTVEDPDRPFESCHHLWPDLDIRAAYDMWSISANLTDDRRYIEGFSRVYNYYDGGGSSFYDMATDWQ
ncbi:MAG: DUF5050 domain-containing protein, partial [Firmicutes bacterium]|nr:DUF5050 domain-containing protein [Bacillota bacterium]